ncbi:MAG: DinB family protein [Bacteroidota bacterium]
MFTHFHIDWLMANRTKLVKIIDQYSDDFLFEVPQGFNNNIIWHMGHIVVSQQRVLYMRSGLPMHISTVYHDFFKNGTSPSTWSGKPDTAEIKDSLLNTVERLKEDLKKDIFHKYEPMVMPVGYTVNNHLEGISYTNLHEAEHTGNLLYLSKFMNTK